MHGTRNITHDLIAHSGMYSEPCRPHIPLQVHSHTCDDNAGIQRSTSVRYVLSPVTFTKPPIAALGHCIVVLPAAIMLPRAWPAVVVLRATGAIASAVGWTPVVAVVRPWGAPLAAVRGRVRVGRVRVRCMRACSMRRRPSATAAPLAALAGYLQQHPALAPQGQHMGSN